jgi:hypothetical protein
MKEFLSVKCLWATGIGAHTTVGWIEDQFYANPDKLSLQGWTVLASHLEPPRQSYENCEVHLFLERDIKKHATRGGIHCTRSDAHKIPSECVYKVAQQDV